MTSKNGNKNTAPEAGATSTSTNLIPEPKRLSVGETEAGLVKINIQLRKYKLSVIEADGFTNFKISSLVNELLKDLGEPKEYTEKVRANMLTEVWATLFCCSDGEVPDRDQFFNLPERDLAFWIETAKELGYEFYWLDGLNSFVTSEAERLAQEAEEEKKSATTP